MSHRGGTKTALDVALVPIDWPSGDAERPFLSAVDLARRPRRSDAMAG